MKITLEINKLTEFERIMATLKEVFDAAKNQQNAIVAALGVFNGLIAEMKLKPRQRCGYWMSR